MQSLFTFLAPYLTSPITWISFTFGACIGSFLNVCILRIPQKTFWKDLRSVCTHCGTPIPFWHNIPVLSWFILRGKAACCRQPISFQYPLVEAFTGFMFVLIYWKFPFVIRSGSQITLDSLETIRFAHAAVFCSLLIICSVIDLHLQIIPDVISLPMVACTPLVVFLHPELDWQSALYGVLAGGGSLYALGLIYYLVRREVGMGMGDVKLLAGIGGWLGYQSLVPTLFISSISGAAIGIGVILVTRSGSMKVKIPFGPFLAIGAVLYLLFGQEINQFLFYRES
ncbi:prepilin peptidase [Pseudobacteriovorax antillogorgiicola]|uniref:Prepilin leader peptidase/N-methyltransferase n=2 Tax=Pseudobacteriovorax antillogorgiicola TaxID=1513793 RepID=A0A1Y6B862_9BACT|nr:A24 family peptidase [Pseudobacteriovorax antillogorgiicola]TCS58637.1 type 4 prepilin peptidase 1 [Pseudobacteriovorax antillogorgiicola]SME96544.1 type 4 prepilin peptidase 1 Aspartic peptidase. MEROPS family A24A [Pseudobacteriovorax antillogorgiicola]